MKYNAEVDTFLANKTHPLTNEIQKIREIVPETDSRVEV